MCPLSAKSPSFRGLEAASDAAAASKRANPSTNTVPEVLLRRALWSLGLRYRIHFPQLPGKPDIVFPRYKVAVFCDGDFWHGRDWQSRRRRLARGTNAEYWIRKIKANILRDRQYLSELNSLGWVVLRFWETDIKRDPQGTAKAVRRVLSTQGRQLPSNRAQTSRRAREATLLRGQQHEQGWTDRRT
jgi:DNA mismatch endonuclease, patch repair protein